MRFDRFRPPPPVWLLSLAAAGLLSACATAEESARLDAGWKPGHVEVIGTAADIGPRHARLDCRPMSADSDPAARFVDVHYTHGRLRRSVIAPLPVGQDISIGQRVWVNTHECRPVEPRSSKG